MLKEKLDIEMPLSKLYRDEIEEINKLVKKNKSEITRIIADNFVTDTLEDFYSNDLDNKRFSSFRIEIVNPSVVIQIDEWGTQLIADDNSSSSWLVGKIQNTITKGTNGFISFVTDLKKIFKLLPYLLIVLAIFMLISILLIDQVKVRMGEDVYERYKTLLTVPFVIPILAMGMFILLRDKLRKQYSGVIMKKRDDDKSFFHKHKDEIILHLINSIIVGVISFLLGKAS